MLEEIKYTVQESLEQNTAIRSKARTPTCILVDIQVGKGKGDLEVKIVFF